MGESNKGKMGLKTEILNRFMQHVIQVGPSWIWTGALSDNGYGKFRIGNRICRAHQIAYLLFNGEIPSGLQVHHTCDIKACVNPAHLWVGTQRQNVQDSWNKGRRSHFKRSLVKNFY
jgi:hypothetical protein